MDKRVKNTRERIIKFAIDFLSDHEEKEFYNAMICNELQISKHTLYHHYPNLSILYDELFYELVTKWKEKDKKIDTLDEFLIVLIDFNKENHKLIQAIYKTNPLKLEYESKISFRNYMEKYKAVDVKSSNEVYHLYFLYAGISEVVFKWFQNGCDISKEEIKGIIDLYINK